MSAAHGGPAFPLSDSGAIAYAQMQEDLAGSKLTDGDRAYYEAKLKAQGMTLRDYFAGKALPAVISTESSWRDLGFKPVNGVSLVENTALCAYHVADAMLKARGA